MDIVILLFFVSWNFGVDDNKRSKFGCPPMCIAWTSNQHEEGLSRVVQYFGFKADMNILL